MYFTVMQLISFNFLTIFPMCTDEKIVRKWMHVYGIHELAEKWNWYLQNKLRFWKKLRLFCQIFFTENIEIPFNHLVHSRSMLLHSSFEWKIIKNNFDVLIWSRFSHSKNGPFLFHIILTTLLNTPICDDYQMIFSLSGKSKMVWEVKLSTW